MPPTAALEGLSAAAPPPSLLGATAAASQLLTRAAAMAKGAVVVRQLEARLGALLEARARELEALDEEFPLTARLVVPPAEAGADSRGSGSVVDCR